MYRVFLNNPKSGSCRKEEKKKLVMKYGGLINIFLNALVFTNI